MRGQWLCEHGTTALRILSKRCLVRQLGEYNAIDHYYRLFVELGKVSPNDDRPDFQGIEVRSQSAGSVIKAPRPLRGWPSSVWFTAVALVFGLELFGLALGPFGPPETLPWTIGFYMCVYTIVPAQICVLQVPLVFGAGSLRHRVRVYWLLLLAVLAGWYGCLWLAINSRSSSGVASELVEMAFWLPPFLMILQLPLWGLRWIGRLVLKNPRCQDGQAAKPNVWLVTLSLIGLTIGGYRILWIWSEPNAEWYYVQETIGMAWRTAGIAIAIVPPTIGWLWPGHLSYLIAWLTTILYAAVIVLLACLVLAWLRDTHFDGGGKAIVATMTAGFTIAYALGLNLLRHFGWRLVQYR